MMTRDVLIAQIMNTAPFMLPPIFHGNGVYSIDCQYLGENLSKIGVSLEECMEAYFHFITKQNYRKGNPINAMSAAPIRPGATINQIKFPERLGK
jgi:hypothetical protein